VGGPRRYIGRCRNNRDPSFRFRRCVIQLDSRQLQRTGQRQHGQMLWRQYENRPMTSGHTARWRKQILISASLACIASISAACSLTNVNGSCNAQGGGNGATCGSRTSQGPSPSSTPKTRPALASHGKPKMVWIATGSEDDQFFADPAVQSQFLKHGYKVNAIGVGSLDMVSPQFCFARYDVLFPSSSVVADQLLQRQGTTGIRGEVNAFTTPLVALTWQPLVMPMIKAGLASRNSDGTYTFHLGAYMHKTLRQELWTDIVPRSVFGQSSRLQAQISDPRRSNSGAMFIAAASYVLNKNSVVADEAAIRRVAGPLRNALKGLGYLEPTSDPVIDNYLTYYMNGAPLVFTYESEFIDRVLPAELELSKYKIPKPVMMYLDPSVPSDHTLMARTDSGHAVVNLLLHDHKLRSAEEAHGFRLPSRPLRSEPNDGVAIEPPGQIVRPPTLTDLEALIDAIEPASSNAVTPASGSCKQ
jgi:hypothetical protein